LNFRRKSLESQTDDQADETETEVKIEETEKREAIWMKNRCEFRADDERENELVDKVEDLDEERKKETVSFRADNEINSQETVKADKVELNYSDQTSFMICWRVISCLHIQCISFKSSSSLNSFKCLVSS